MPLVALTTVQAFDKVEGGLKGKKVLVHAGAGGVGSFAIQYAHNQVGRLSVGRLSVGRLSVGLPGSVASVHVIFTE